MIVERLIARLPIRSTFAKLAVGSILTALVIALGMICILRLLGFSVNPVIPAAVGVIGAAVYAAGMRR